MILPHFLKVCAYALGFFLFGLAALALDSFHSFLNYYHVQLFTAALIAVRALLLCLVLYIFFMAYMIVERRAIENERFRSSGVDILPPVADQQQFSRVKSMDISSRVIDAYNDLLRQDEIPSLSKIAILVFGQKGGSYTNQVKQVLAEEEIYL